jgi:hypothetical protein
MARTDSAPTPRVMRPGGGLPLEVIALRVGLAGVLLCAAFAISMLLLPLSEDRSLLTTSGENRAGPSESPLASAGSARTMIAERGANSRLVAELGGSYLFLLDRSPRMRIAPEVEIGDRAIVDASDENPPSEGKVSAPTGDTATGGVRVVRVEKAEDVGGEIRDSYKELVLRAIHSDRSGRLVALIDHSKAGASGAAERVREGDSFTEPKHESHPWRVVVIDPDRNRVVLERQERRLALALFGTGPADLSPVVIQPESEAGQPVERVRVAEDGTVIVEKRPDEAIAELRGETGAPEPGESEITLQDLADLFDAMRDLERYAEQDRIERERRRRD